MPPCVVLLSGPEPRVGGGGRFGIRERRADPKGAEDSRDAIHARSAEREIQHGVAAGKQTLRALNHKGPKP